MDRRYALRFLPLFEQDLNCAVDYIAIELQNPEAFEVFRSRRQRAHPYYRIGVGNYNVFYVIIGDVMEVRRLLYSGRDWQRML